MALSPAGFLGHSAGEIACAYADGGFTHAQVPPAKLFNVIVPVFIAAALALSFCCCFNMRCCTRPDL